MNIGLWKTLSTAGMVNENFLANHGLGDCHSTSIAVEWARPATTFRRALRVKVSCANQDYSHRELRQTEVISLTQSRNHLQASLG